MLACYNKGYFVLCIQYNLDISSLVTLLSAAILNVALCIQCICIYPLKFKINSEMNSCVLYMHGYEMHVLIKLYICPPVYMFQFML